MTGTAPERFDVFLSHNSRDKAVVERIAVALKRAGVEPWLDKWSLTPGGDWQRELGAGLDASVSCAVFVGPHDLGAWELQEMAVAIDRAARQEGFRVFPVLLPGVEEPFDPNRLPHFLRARTWVDFRRGRDDGRALQDLINAVKGVPFGPAAAVARREGVAPYRGLRVFAEEDARFFFGRDREVQRLLEKVKASAFVAVLGPSGSGKSSLVRAGLVPALRAGALADVEAWHVLVLRPGAAPLTALAAQLAGLRDGRAMQATVDELRGDPRSLHLSVELALADRPAGERVLVVVDQLEEVFTQCRDEDERRGLFAALLYAASAPGGRTVVLVTMRADFYARCAAYPELAQLITAQQMLVGPMDADALRQAIEEPARRVGLELEEGLADTILADVAAEPGALPLLEHALLELWERRRGDLLTLEGYREAGGVHGALAQRADRIYGELDAGQQQIARRALLRLTQPGEGTEDTRRRAPRDELAPAGGGERADAVLARLVDARMLTTGRDETGREVVDVSHEALIRGWPRLRGWIDADRAGLLTHRRLTDAAREWDALHREPGALYRGARLAAAREWAAEHPDDPSALERDFLAAGHAAEHDELDAARRRTRRLRTLASGLAALSAIVVALAVWALGERSTAQRQTTEARSLALASTASSLVGTRPDVALLLGLEANRSSTSPEARSSAVAALTAARDPGVLAILHGHTDGVRSVASSGDGRLLASGGGDGAVRLWDARTHAPLGAPLTGHVNGVNGVAFRADGRVLASAGDDGTVRLWAVRTGRPLGQPLVGHAGAVSGVAFSADGRLVASAGSDGTVRLWDVRRRAQRGAPLGGDAGAVRGVAFAPGGGMLACAGTDGTIRLWDVRRRTQRGAPLRGHAGDVDAVAFSADGRLLASAGSDGTVRLWDARTHAPRGAPMTRHAGTVRSVAFRGDGRVLASGGDDGTVRLWDVRTRSQRGPALRGHTGAVLGVTFAPGGRTLASASADRTLRVWDPRTRTAFGAPLRGHAGGTDVATRPDGRVVPVSGAVRGVAIGGDGRVVASAGDDDTVRLWDVRTRRPLGAPLRGHAGAVSGVAFGRGGRVLASGSADRTVRLWDVRTRRPLGAPLRGHVGRVLGVALTPDGRLLASGGADRTVRRWDVRTRRPLGAPLRGHDGGVLAVALAPDGGTLASADDAGRVVLWDLRADAPRAAVLGGHTSAVLGVAFSPDGRTLASAGEDRTIRLWDVRTRRPLGVPLTGYTGAVTSVAFSPDGRTLASASADRAVRLWDVRSRMALGGPLTGHAGAVTGVAFTPDGRTLASSGADGTVRLWDRVLWRTFGELQADVCRLVGTGLSRAEWERYASGVGHRRSCP